MMCDVVSVLLLLLSCPLSPTRGTECNEGYVEWQGRCEECETAVLAGWEVKDSCPQCPDVTKRGLHCHVSCSEKCAEGCERWTGRCHGCKKDPLTGHGTWGDRCEDFCSLNCKIALCNQTKGDCQDGCEDGFFGRRCDQRCPSSCLCENGKSCTHTPCTMEGNCVYPCKDGYYGGDCNTPCPAGCSSNSCTREGKCHACRHGSYGDQCQLPCSDHCTLKQCRQDTGVCSSGCEAGFWGETCLTVCPDSCVDCTSLTDGTACQHRCRGHCRGGCNDSGECKQCKDGFYAIDCNRVCSQHCVSLTDGRGACNRSSGHCLHGCKDGYRGVYCQVPCPDHCQTCSQRHVGCGQCQDGWYGSVCQERCQDCSGPCHQDTGNCRVAVTTAPDPHDESRDIFVGLCSFLGGVATTVLLEVIVCACKRRRGCCQGRRREEPVRDPEHIYESLGMQAQPADVPGVQLHNYANDSD